MKRWLLLALVLIIAIAPVEAVGAKKKKKKPPASQVVEGGVLLAVPAPTAPETCFSGLHRRLVLVAGEEDPPQDLVGHSFDVDKATWNGKFVLEVTFDENSPGGVDLDIVFYPDFGDQTAVGKTISYESRGSDGEEGTIPSNMTKAIVCMYSGFASAFRYTGIGK